MLYNMNNIVYTGSIEGEIRINEMFTNIDERYGDPVAVTIDDYRELNPGGEFWQNEAGIYETGHGQIAEASNKPLEVTVQRHSGYQRQQMQVVLNGVDRLTPKSARAALQAAFGQPYDGTAWSPNMDYGYRVYKNSARKIYPRWL